MCSGIKSYCKENRFGKVIILDSSFTNCGVLNLKKNMNEISNGANIALNLVFILYALLCIVPFLLILSVSLSDESSVRINGYKLIPDAISFTGYEYIVRGAEALMRSYGITIFATVSGTLLSVLIIALFAYPLSRKDFKYRKQISFFVFLTMIFNGGLVPWYMVYTQIFHLKNNILIYIIPYLMNAWYVIIMRTFFSTAIPDSIIEAAKIDGAGESRIFFGIVLRLSLPGLATIALFSSITYWNDWWIPLVFITKEKLFNLQYSMYSALLNAQYLIENASRISNSGGSTNNAIPLETARMAMCITAIGPIALAYPFFQRYFIKGLAVGAVKG